VIISLKYCKNFVFIENEWKRMKRKLLTWYQNLIFILLERLVSSGVDFSKVLEFVLIFNVSFC